MTQQLPSLNSLIDSLCHSRNLGGAVRLTLSHALEPHLYSKILQLCTNLKSLQYGKLVHSRIIRDGIPSDTCLDTRLIILYSKFGRMESARKVFDRMSERSVVTWTALVSGYSRTAHYEEALRVFSAIHAEGIKANQFTYGSVLSACTRLSSLEWGMQIQGFLQKGRFISNLFVQSALVNLHSKCGKMEDACSVFDSMEARDLVSWNAMIGGYAAQQLSDSAILVFRRMLREGMRPDSFSFGSLLKVTMGNVGYAKVNMFHGYIFQFGLGSDKFLRGSLTDAYVKCGSLDHATRVYNTMQNKDLVSCTTLINGYANACEDIDCTAALQIFNEVQKTMVTDSVLLCSMINICAKTASLSLGRQIHANALKFQCQRDTPMGNALIDMYSKAGVIRDAEFVFHEMEEKNVISWTSLITGYGKHGYGREAFALYAKMENEGLKPNDVTFLSLLFACSHNGLTREGLQCFSDMVNKHKILPRAEHYSCLVDLLARSGRLEEAYDLVRNIRADVDASGLRSMLGACSTYGDMNLGGIVGRRLLSLEPGNPGNYVALSGIYAGSGLWQNAGHTRMLMKKTSASKHPGYSLCQLTREEAFSERKLT